jgi:uncharacterized protein (TIGR02594 family)
MMRLRKRATLLLCAAATVSFAGSAMARPAHKASHHRHAAVAAGAFDARSADAQPYPIAGSQAYAAPNASSRGEGRRASRATRSHSGDAYGGFTSNSLVSEARSFMGTNPTGRGSAWCGAFMDLVLKKTGHAGGGNLARGYARYGTRVSGPQVGAIAVMNHHVGVVSGIDPNGNPIIVSGNHNRTVAESVYPRGRIVAYVMPGS